MVKLQLGVEDIVSSVAVVTNTNQHIVSPYEPFQLLLVVTVPTLT